MLPSHFQKWGNLPFLWKIYPKPSNLPQGLNFGMLGKVQMLNGFSSLYAFPLLGPWWYWGYSFHGRYWDTFLDCKLVHKLVHTHTEEFWIGNWCTNSEPLVHLLRSQACLCFAERERLKQLCKPLLVSAANSCIRSNYLSAVEFSELIMALWYYADWQLI